jgi:enamine deaminase RidA (YjgF/YER057c/UK114 family)
MTRRNISSGSPYEPVIGFSRAVKVDGRVLVSGTGPIEADGSLAPDAGGQARRSLAIIEAALAQAGASLADVVRTRVYLTDPADADVVFEAHGALFGNIRPASTFVIVAALLNADWKVEIEAEAIIS